MFKIFILQIDSLSQLKTNSGFWDNFVWPLGVAAVIGVVGLLYKLAIFLIKRLNTKAKQEIVQNELQKKLQCDVLNSFIELCQVLITLTDDNKYIYQTYGPNSSAGEVEELRTDLTLWHSVRVDYIVPNNEMINCLIEKNKHLIPESLKPQFLKLTTHIYAFKKHIENPAFDYTEYQYPKEIEKLIKDICFFYVTSQDKQFTAICYWLQRNLNISEVLNAYLFGSVLFSTKYNGDIDVVLILDELEPSNLLKLKEKFDKLNKSFTKEFGKALHLEIFTSIENEGFLKFLDRNLYKYKI